VVKALEITGSPALGILLYNLLAHGFSWRDLGVSALVLAFFFLVVLFFTRPDRFGRECYLGDRKATGGTALSRMPSSNTSSSNETSRGSGAPEA
jgi:hypothetical protein